MMIEVEHEEDCGAGGPAIGCEERAKRIPGPDRKEEEKEEK